MLTSEYERGFARSDLATVGLEEELILVDAESFQPTASAAIVLDALSDARFVAEFRSAQIEIVTPVLLTVADLRRELASSRSASPMCSLAAWRCLRSALIPAPQDRLRSVLIPATRRSPPSTRG